MPPMSVNPSTAAASELVAQPVHASQPQHSTSWLDVWVCTSQTNTVNMVYGEDTDLKSQYYFDMLCFLKYTFVAIIGN